MITGKSETEEELSDRVQSEGQNGNFLCSVNNSYDSRIQINPSISVCLANNGIRWKGFVL